MTFLSTRLATAAALLATSAIALPFIASAGISLGDSIGLSDEEILTGLESQGYVIIEIEREDDEVEAEATLNGVEFEIEIDPKTGLITEIEQED